MTAAVDYVMVMYLILEYLLPQVSETCFLTSIKYSFSYAEITMNFTNVSLF